MTPTADTETRTNRDGDPCPPWCVTDHGKYSFHAAEEITVEAPKFRSCFIRAIRHGLHSAPQVQVAARGVLYARADEAGELAGLIEELATATPAQHRELAAAIRKAAADITGTTEETR